MLRKGNSVLEGLDLLGRSGELSGQIHGRGLDGCSRVHVALDVDLQLLDEGLQAGEHLVGPGHLLFEQLEIPQLPVLCIARRLEGVQVRGVKLL